MVGIPGIHHSAVQQQDTNRRETVKTVDSAVRESPAQGVFPAGLEKDVFSDRPKKLITDMGSTEIFELCSKEGQFFITFDDDALDDLKGSLPRSEKSSHVRGWIRGNTKIGTVLDVKVCYHQGLYGVEIMIESLFRDRTVSWVRIVNGINKSVTETSEEIPIASVENRGAGKPVAMAKSRPKPTFTLTPVSVP